MTVSRKLLSSEELHQHASKVLHWRIVEGKKLARAFTFPDFQRGLSFVNHVGAIAEQLGHHPDVHLSWGHVEVETWTHDAGGLTEQDFLLAAKIDQLG